MTASKGPAFLVWVFLAAIPPAVHSQTVVPSFAPSGTTDPLVWFENDTRTGGVADIVSLDGLGGDLESSQPFPTSAALLTTTMTDAAKAEVGVLDDYGAPLSIFPSLNLSYSYFKATNAGQNPLAAPSLKLTFFNPVCDDPISSGDCFIQLIYEPYWNGSPPPIDTWTTESITPNSGLFWSTGGFGVPSGAGGPPLFTLSEWMSALSSDFGDATMFRVSIGVGTFNQGQIGYFDAVSISHSSGAGYNASYDFGVTPPPPPPPPPPEPAAVPIPVIWLLPLVLVIAGMGGVRARKRGS